MKDKSMKYYLVAINLIFCCALQAGKPPIMLKSTHETHEHTQPKPHQEHRQEGVSHKSAQADSDSVHSNREQPPQKKIYIDPELEQRIAAKKEKWQKQQDIFTTTESLATASSIAKVPITMAKPALSGLKQLPTVLTVGGALAAAGGGLATAAGIAIVGESNPLDQPAQEQPIISTQEQDFEVEEVP